MGKKLDDYKLYVLTYYKKDIWYVVSSRVIMK